MKPLSILPKWYLPLPTRENEWLENSPKENNTSRPVNHNSRFYIMLMKDLDDGRPSFLAIWIGYPWKARESGELVIQQPMYHSVPAVSTILLIRENRWIFVIISFDHIQVSNYLYFGICWSMIKSKIVNISKRDVIKEHLFFWNELNRYGNTEHQS